MYKIPYLRLVITAHIPIQVIDCGLGHPGFESRQEREIFLFFRTSRPVLWHSGYRRSLLDIQRRSDGVKNEWRYSSAPLSQYDRGNFAFYYGLFSILILIQYCCNVTDELILVLQSFTRQVIVLEEILNITMVLIAMFLEGVRRAQFESERMLTDCQRWRY